MRTVIQILKQDLKSWEWVTAVLDMFSEAEKMGETSFLPD